MLSPDNKEYTITTEKEISYILSRFDEDFIYNTIEEYLEYRKQYYQPYSKAPNIVEGYEDNFKRLLVDYPGAQTEILAKRNEVLVNILKILCDKFQLRFEDYDQYDLFTSVKYMYDFLICNFYAKIIDFMVAMIYKEKDGIYASIDQSALRKKDITSVYSKKVYSDQKLATISDNLELVINNICTMDITLQMYISNIYEKTIADHLNAVIAPCNDFFKEYIKTALFDINIIPIITEIRLRLCSGMISEAGIQQFQLLEEENKNE